LLSRAVMAQVFSEGLLSRSSSAAGRVFNSATCTRLGGEHARASGCEWTRFLQRASDHEPRTAPMQAYLAPSVSLLLAPLTRTHRPYMIRDYIVDLLYVHRTVRSCIVYMGLCCRACPAIWSTCRHIFAPRFAVEAAYSKLSSTLGSLAVYAVISLLSTWFAKVVCRYDGCTLRRHIILWWTGQTGPCADHRQGLDLILSHLRSAKFLAQRSSARHHQRDAPVLSASPRQRREQYARPNGARKQRQWSRDQASESPGRRRG
jgi:hypothetical protein